MYAMYLLFEGAWEEGAIGGVDSLSGIYRSLELARAAANTSRFAWNEILEIVAGRPGRLWHRQESGRGPTVWSLMEDPWRPPEMGS